MRKLVYSGVFVLLCILGSGSGAFAVGAPADPPSTKIPDNIRALLAPSDTLLAYKAADSLEGDGNGAVIVIRHALTDDRSHNPCDLEVLQKKGDAFVVASSSNRVVECIYNDIARRAGEMALDDHLDAKPKEITWSNEQTRGHTIFRFAYSSEKSSWYLQRAEVTFAENAESGDGVDVYKEVVNYPDDIAWIAMPDFNPGAIRKVLANHRKAVK